MIISLKPIRIICWASIQVSLCWQMFIFAVSVGRTAVYICISTGRAELILDMRKQGFVLFFLFQIKDEAAEKL